MVLAIDTYYLPEEAHTVGVIFELGCSYPHDIIKSILPSDKYSSYIPGEFYKRELPPILDLLRKISLNGIEYIIIDGYILLKDNDGNIKDGLGMHLSKALNGKHPPIIGVAKSNYCRTKEISYCKLSHLFIQGYPISNNIAGNIIKSMSWGVGNLPTILQTLDKETKKGFL